MVCTQMGGRRLKKNEMSQDNVSAINAETETNNTTNELVCQPQTPRRKEIVTGHTAMIPDHTSLDMQYTVGQKMYIIPDKSDRTYAMSFESVSSPDSINFKLPPPIKVDQDNSPSADRNLNLPVISQRKLIEGTFSVTEFIDSHSFKLETQEHNSFLERKVNPNADFQQDKKDIRPSFITSAGTGHHLELEENQSLNISYQGQGESLVPSLAQIDMPVSYQGQNDSSVPWHVKKETPASFLGQSEISVPWEVQNATPVSYEGHNESSILWQVQNENKISNQGQSERSINWQGQNEISVSYQKECYQGMLPRGQVPAMLPRGQVPAMLPRGQVPAMLPRGQVPGMLPCGQVPGMLPCGQVPGMLPSGPGMLPSGPGMLPRGQEPGMLPRGQEPGMLPGGQVTGMLPSGQVTGMLPSGQVPGMLPSGQVPGMLPSGQMPGMLQNGHVPGMLPSGQVQGTPRSRQVSGGTHTGQKPAMIQGQVPLPPHLRTWPSPQNQGVWQLSSNYKPWSLPPKQRFGVITSAHRPHVIVPGYPLPTVVTPHTMVIKNTSNQMSVTNSTPAQMSISNITPAQMSISNTTHAQMSISNTTHAQMSVYNTTPTLVSVYNTTPAIMSVYNTTPAQMSVYNTIPAQMSVYNTTPAQISIYNTTPAQMCVYDTTPTEMYVSNNTPDQTSVYNTTPASMPVSNTIPIQMSDAAIPMKQRGISPSSLFIQPDSVPQYQASSCDNLSKEIVSTTAKILVETTSQSPLRGNEPTYQMRSPVSPTSLITWNSQPSQTIHTPHSSQARVQSGPSQTRGIIPLYQKVGTTSPSFLTLTESQSRKRGNRYPLRDRENSLPSQMCENISTSQMTSTAPPLLMAESISQIQLRADAAPFEMSGTESPYQTRINSPPSLRRVLTSQSLTTETTFQSQLKADAPSFQMNETVSTSLTRINSSSSPILGTTPQSLTEETVCHLQRRGNALPFSFRETVSPTSQTYSNSIPPQNLRSSSQSLLVEPASRTKLRGTKPPFHPKERAPKFSDCNIFRRIDLPNRYANPRTGPLRSWDLYTPSADFECLFAKFFPAPSGFGEWSEADGYYGAEGPESETKDTTNGSFKKSLSGVTSELAEEEDPLRDILATHMIQNIISNQENEDYMMNNYTVPHPVPPQSGMYLPQMSEDATAPDYEKGLTFEMQNLSPSSELLRQQFGEMALPSALSEHEDISGTSTQQLPQNEETYSLYELHGTGVQVRWTALQMYWYDKLKQEEIAQNTIGQQPGSPSRTDVPEPESLVEGTSPGEQRILGGSSDDLNGYYMMYGQNVGYPGIPNQDELLASDHYNSEFSESNYDSYSVNGDIDPVLHNPSPRYHYLHTSGSTERRYTAEGN